MIVTSASVEVVARSGETQSSIRAERMSVTQRRRDQTPTTERASIAAKSCAVGSHELFFDLTPAQVNA